VLSGDFCPTFRKWILGEACFEIGSFLLLQQVWQGLDKIRILMGDETTRRTEKEIVESLRKKSDASMEGETERDDTLTGLAAIREAKALFVVI